MTLKIYTVYDSKVEAFMQPFFMQTKGAALRAWQDTVNDKQSMFNKHPADYTLFEIGEFDDSNASISMYDAKTPIGTALEFINSDQQ